MTSEPPTSSRPPHETGDSGDDTQSVEMSPQDWKIARGRRLYDNVGGFRDVFKIVVVVAILIAIAIVFLL